MALRYLVDELRKVDPMPRRARLRMRETQRAGNELAQTLGHVPTEPEVARRLGVEVREHRALLDRFAPA
jgi:RNA polymerase sigma factor for flagellar operon FliA